jgi:hypothetical protein
VATGAPEIRGEPIPHDQEGVRLIAGQIADTGGHAARDHGREPRALPASAGLSARKKAAAEPA